jgi:hypothetical protein
VACSVVQLHPVWGHTTAANWSPIVAPDACYEFISFSAMLHRTAAAYAAGCCVLLRACESGGQDPSRVSCEGQAASPVGPNNATTHPMLPWLLVHAGDIPMMLHYMRLLCVTGHHKPPSPGKCAAGQTLDRMPAQMGLQSNKLQRLWAEVVAATAGSAWP